MRGSEVLYRVRPGDTLSGIAVRVMGANRYGVDQVVREVIRLNPAVKDKNVLRSGQVLHLPSGHPGITEAFFDTDLRRVQMIADQTHQDTWDLLLRNFDMLQPEASFGVGMSSDFWTFGELGIPAVSKNVLRSNTQITKELEVTFSAVRTRFFGLRNGTMVHLSRLRLNVRVEPITVIEVTRTGLYALSEKLEKLLLRAKHLGAGKVLLGAEAITSAWGAKDYYARTGDGLGTGRYALREVGGLGMQFLASEAAAAACLSSALVPALSLALCGGALVATLIYSKNVGNAFGESVADQFGMPGLK